MEIAIHFELRRDARDEISAADYLEIIDLRTSGPTDDQLLAFKLSDSAQERLVAVRLKARFPFRF